MNDAPTKPLEATIYDRAFLLAYVSNLFMMTAVSLLYRYQDFIVLGGGDELDLGLVVGLGTLGAILCRAFQGALIDRFGPGRLWHLSIALMIASLLWHLQIRSVHSIEVYLARFLYATGMAGVFGSWMTFVTLRVPARRVAESIGVVGSSGFAGMALGPLIGDWIFRQQPDRTMQVAWMFGLAAGLHLISLLFSVVACRVAGRIPVHRIDEPHDPGSFWSLVRLRHPLALTLVGVALGLNNSLPGNFVRPLCVHLHIKSIAWFFLTYNVVAFSFRLILRRTFETFGLPRMIVAGFLVVSVSMFLYVSATTVVSLTFPAIAAGLAHAMLYPAIIASGTGLYPSRLRGAATNLMLATYDVGVLVGAPAVGFIISHARQINLPEYPTMFCIVGAFNLLVVTIYRLRAKP